MAKKGFCGSCGKETRWKKKTRKRPAIENPYTSEEKRVTKKRKEWVCGKCGAMMKVVGSY